MKFSEIPKFVVNLDRRPENMKLIHEEMEYIGWSYERFSAVDTNSYMGCTLSHLGVLEIAKERGYERVMVIEDDCYFMPYSKSLLEHIENESEELTFSVINMSPTLNRDLNLSQNYKTLLDITNIPPKRNQNLTETFATNMMLYDKSIYDKMFDISTTAFTSSGAYYFPIDGYLAQHIYPKYQSYCPVLPIAPQRESYSDVSHGMYNNYYTQVYNWNEYSPVKMDRTWIHRTNVDKIKQTQKHIPYNVS